MTKKKNKSKKELEKELGLDNYFKEVKRILKRVSIFIKPIEEFWSGTGLLALFSWLACRTGAGVICTSPMGGGKTLLAEITAYLMDRSGCSDHCITIQEFKKTDWKEIFPAHAEDESFHFNVPEISAMPKYSQEFFWSRIPALQSDGKFNYRFPGGDGEEGGAIVFENCEASYFIASQPPKTHAIINDTTFKTLANDRCWNVILVNQLRGSENIDISKIPEKLSELCLEAGTFTKIILPDNKQFEHFPEEQHITEKVNNKSVKKILLGVANVKFRNGSKIYKSQAYHVTKSTLDISDLEDIIRNQYSVNRRDEQINDILREWGVFLNIAIIEQVHVDLFVALFGFYISLFNSLTVGSVEQSINIKYGAVEMLCRISDLIARDKTVTQQLLTKEFNAKTDDVSHHVSELLKAHILKSKKPVIKDKKKKRKIGKKAKPRSQRAKTPKAVREQVKVLNSAGLITQRRACKIDQSDSQDITVRETVYSFTDTINDFFHIYATILNDTLPKNILAKIPHINKFLNINNKNN